MIKPESFLINYFSSAQKMDAKSLFHFLCEVWFAANGAKSLTH